VSFFHSRPLRPAKRPVILKDQPSFAMSLCVVRLDADSLRDGSDWQPFQWFLPSRAQLVAAFEGGGRRRPAPFFGVLDLTSEIGSFFRIVTAGFW